MFVAPTERGNECGVRKIKNSSRGQQAAEGNRRHYETLVYRGSCYFTCSNWRRRHEGHKGTCSRRRTPRDRSVRYGGDRRREGNSGKPGESRNTDHCNQCVSVHEGHVLG